MQNSQIGIKYVHDGIIQWPHPSYTEESGDLGKTGFGQNLADFLACDWSKSINPWLWLVRSWGSKRHVEPHSHEEGVLFKRSMEILKYRPGVPEYIGISEADMRGECNTKLTTEFGDELEVPI